MTSTPYRELRKELGHEDDWTPTWAQRLEVRRHGDTTVYLAHPETISADELTELARLHATGWQITLDSPRLNRLRIQLWK